MERFGPGIQNASVDIHAQPGVFHAKSDPEIDRCSLLLLFPKALLSGGDVGFVIEYMYLVGAASLLDFTG